LFHDEDFEREIQREKARAERKGSHFTVGYLRLLDSKNRPIKNLRVFELLTSVIRNRIRATDTVKLIKIRSPQVGIIFSETTGDNVSYLIGEFENAFLEQLASGTNGSVGKLRVFCDLCTYPSRARVGGGSSQESGAFSDRDHRTIAKTIRSQHSRVNGNGKHQVWESVRQAHPLGGVSEPGANGAPSRSRTGTENIG
jgi:hypothetical protein